MMPRRASFQPPLAPPVTPRRSPVTDQNPRRRRLFSIIEYYRVCYCPPPLPSPRRRHATLVFPPPEDRRHHTAAPPLLWRIAETTLTPRTITAPVAY